LIKTYRKERGAADMRSVPFMRPPDQEYEYQVGDTVEVLCDHNKGGERVRGWLKGIVVQVDPKMVAVQFRSDVFLTDGWMVPDHILWYPQKSPHIRVPEKKIKSDLPKVF
jgi:hypothetical protein